MRSRHGNSRVRCGGEYLASACSSRMGGEGLPSASLRVCIFWLQGSCVSFVPFNVDVTGDFCFSLLPFSYKGKGRKKNPISLPFQPTWRNAGKTPAFPSEALSPLVMKPHHHLNCSILKVCGKGIKLIFPISLLSVISVASLLQCCISWEQESKPIWKLEALLRGLGTKK